MRKINPNEPNEKPKTKKKFKINFRFLIIVGVIAYAAFALINQQITLSGQTAEKTKLEESAQELSDEKEFLQRELDYIGTKDYIEQAAREKLGWIKKDEIIFRRTEDGKVVKTTPEEMQKILDEKSGGTETAGAQPSGTNS